jgi:hypothetical protein
MKPLIAYPFFAPEPAVADPPPAAPAAPVVPVPAASAAPGPAAPAAAPAAPPVAPAAADIPPAGAVPVAPAPAGPVVPEVYTLALPANTLFTQLDVDATAAEAKAMQLTQQQAQALLQVRSDSLRAQADTYLAETKADPEVGGAKFETSVADAVRGRDALFPPGSKGADLIRHLLDVTGFGNHVEFIRGFARIGRSAREDRAPGGGGGAVAPPNETLEQRAARQFYPTNAPPAQ